MWNFGHLIPGKFCFWREMYHLDGYVGLFLITMFEICKIIQIFDAIFDHIPGKCLHLLSAFHIAAHRPTHHLFNSKRSDGLDPYSHIQHL